MLQLTCATTVCQVATENFREECVTERESVILGKRAVGQTFQEIAQEVEPTFDLKPEVCSLVPICATSGGLCARNLCRCLFFGAFDRFSQAFSGHGAVCVCPFACFWQFWPLSLRPDLNPVQWTWYPKLLTFLFAL